MINKFFKRKNEVKIHCNYKDNYYGDQICIIKGEDK